MKLPPNPSFPPPGAPEISGPAPSVGPAPLAPGWGTLLINWFLPGMGFWLCGRRARGTMQCLVVIVTFAIGVALRGGVDWPSWSLDAPDFNLINNFTFVIQLGAGLPALLSLYAQKLHLGFLAGVPTRPYYELGQYYMIVAGAINYFATCNLHDRLIHPSPRYAAQERPAEAPFAEPS